jgi:hypothetical protein
LFKFLLKRRVVHFSVEKLEEKLYWGEVCFFEVVRCSIFALGSVVPDGYV